MKNLSLYSSYRKEVKKNMKAIHKFLEDKYGAINPEWFASLDLLANNYELLYDCKDQIKKDGLMILDKNGVLVKHSMIKTLLETQIQIVKMLNEFGLTPKSKQKLDNNTDSDSAEDFIDSLMK